MSAVTLLSPVALDPLPSRAPPNRPRGKLDVLYSIMQSIEGKLGGGEGVEGIYGSITLTGMQRIYDCMKHNCGFDGSSTLVDVGAGLGRPLMHALMEPGTKGAFGIELDEVKVTKAHAFLSQAAAELVRKGVTSLTASTPHMLCQSIEEVPSLNPATHAYSFWEGVPYSGKAAFGRLFAASKTLKAVAVVQRSMRNEDPAQMMQSLGFGPLLLISNFVVKMSGSGRNFQAYIFSKIKPESAAFIRRALPPVTSAPHTAPKAPNLAAAEAAETECGAAPVCSHQQGTAQSTVRAQQVLKEQQEQQALTHSQQQQQQQQIELRPPHEQQQPAAAAAAGLLQIDPAQQHSRPQQQGNPLQQAMEDSTSAAVDSGHHQHEDMEQANGDLGQHQSIDLRLPGTPACGDPLMGHKLSSRSARASRATRSPSQPLSQQQQQQQQQQITVYAQQRKGRGQPFQGKTKPGAGKQLDGGTPMGEGSNRSTQTGSNDRRGSVRAAGSSTQASRAAGSGTQASRAAGSGAQASRGREKGKGSEQRGVADCGRGGAGKARVGATGASKKASMGVVGG